MDPEQVLSSIEKEAPSKGLPIIGPRRGELLDKVVRDHSPSNILEVGTLVGYSAIRMARHLGPGKKVTCVEVNPEMARTARENLRKAGLSDRVEVILGDAKSVLPSLSGSFDMVFLDAVKEEYLAYLKGCERLTHRGSVVVADNVKSFAAEMKPYLDYVRTSGKYASTYIESPPNYGDDEGDAIEVSVRL